MIENLFINILEISMTSAAAILIIMLFSKFAEGAFRKKWRYWVWVFLAIYLVIPMKTDFPDAPIKVEIPPHEMIITQKESFVPQQNPFTDANGGFSADDSLETGPEQGMESAVPSPAPESENSEISAGSESTGPRIFVYPIVYVGAVIWAVGTVLVCGWNVAMYIRFSTRSKPWNREIENEEVMELFEKIKAEMGVPKRVRLYENRLIKSPMMVGFFNPRVLLPSEKLMDGEYEFVLRHELTHFKRGDIWYKFLLMLAASVHWFNPMVGTMCRYAENDIEITCDEAVVKAMEGDRRQEYCATILNIMRRGQNSPLLLSTSFYGGAKVLKKRFSAVLEPRAHRGIVLFIIAALVIMISGMMVACGTEGNVPEASAPAPATAEEAAEAAEELIGKVHRSMNIFEENDFGKHLSKETKEYINAMVAETRELITSGYGARDRHEYKARIYLNESFQNENYVQMNFQVIETYYYGRIYSEEVTKDDLTTVSNMVTVVYDFKQKEFTLFLLSDMGDWIGEEYYKNAEIGNMASLGAAKTEEEIVSAAKIIAETAYSDMMMGGGSDYSVLASEAVEEYIREVSDGKQKYIADNNINIDYGTYEVTAELLSAYEDENETEVLLTIHESYEWDDPNTETGYIQTGENSHVKLTYDKLEGRFCDFVIYGITWMDSSYYVTMPSEADPRPTVEGPDENGAFPIISSADWDRWVTYSGISDTAEPEEPISSVLECKDYVEYLAENYPEIDDWEIVYEKGYYALTNCYDPYTYSFRSIYMPRRFAVLKTEQAEDFDRIFVFTYEEYAAVNVVDGGIEPRHEIQFRSCEAASEDINADISEAIILENGTVLPNSLWFPKEKKMLWFDTDSIENRVYVIENINSPINIFIGARIFEGYDLNGKKLVAPAGRENDRFLFIPLSGGREDMTVAYYDYETRTIDIYENCVEGENGVFPQIYFLDSDTLVIDANGVLSFYRTYAHSIMTESFAEIGGYGKGLSDGAVSSIQFMSIDKTKGGRYMFIYSDDQTGEYNICTFDKNGKILSDFSLGLDSEGTLGSASYKSGIVYFSYYPAPYEHDNSMNYAVDARPDKNHNLQANAW